MPVGKDYIRQCHDMYVPVKLVFFGDCDFSITFNFKLFFANGLFVKQKHVRIKYLILTSFRIRRFPQKISLEKGVNTERQPTSLSFLYFLLLKISNLTKKICRVTNIYC